MTSAGDRCMSFCWVSGLPPCQEGKIPMRISRDPDWIEALEGRLLLAAQQSWRGSGAHTFGTPATGSISGQVFRDNNSNGALDAGETGINGVTVFLDLNNT